MLAKPFPFALALSKNFIPCFEYIKSGLSCASAPGIKKDLTAARIRGIELVRSESPLKSLPVPDPTFWLRHMLILESAQEFDPKAE
jgi:hypothetical protein